LQSEWQARVEDMAVEIKENNNNLTEKEPELFEHFRFEIDKGQGQLRIDRFLMSRIMNASRTKIQDATNAGYILVNGNTVKPSYNIKPSDVITVMLTHPQREIELLPEDIPLDIRYEDKDLVVINKPAGMVVHPAFGNYRGTVVNALMGHFRRDGRKPKNNVPGPYLVHRIDKDTSGLMLVAKNENSQMRLSRQFYRHSVQRKYLAVVWGDFRSDKGIIKGHIGRSTRDRKIFTVFPEGDSGKHATTHYKVVERLGYVTLIECELETGRTHQIRVHLKYIGHPLFNDETYGGNEILKGTTFAKYKQFVQNCFKICPRQALHAKSLGFIHPLKGNHLYFESELPKDMTELIDKWRTYAIHKLNDDYFQDI
jgi:23S rRNA pseudouridine1911/1915/1917 synthase